MIVVQILIMVVVAELTMLILNGIEANFSRLPVLNRDSTHDFDNFRKDWEIIYPQR